MKKTEKTQTKQTDIISPYFSCTKKEEKKESIFITKCSPPLLLSSSINNKKRKRHTGVISEFFKTTNQLPEWFFDDDDDDEQNREDELLLTLNSSFDLNKIVKNWKLIIMDSEDFSKLKPINFTPKYIPMVSPYNLVQEQLYHDPWKVFNITLIIIINNIKNNF